MKNMRVLFLTIILFLMLLSFNSTYASEDDYIYDEYGFYIEYPPEWKIEDKWDNQQQEIIVKTNSSEKTEVSIKYQQYLREDITITQELVDNTIENLKEECRINKNGSCWNFKILDSKIIIIENSNALSIKYEEVLNEQRTVTRTILLPEGSNSWEIKWTTIKSGIDYEEDLEKIVNSFQFIQETKIETELDQPTKISLETENTVQRDYKINLILIGEEWSQSTQSAIKEKIPKYNDPMFVLSKEKTRIHHTYNYNFVSISENDVEELSNFMMENSSLVTITGSDIADTPVGQALWIAENHPERVKVDGNGNVVSYEIDYRLINAVTMEKHLYEKFIENDDKLNKTNSVNIFFLAMDLKDVNFLRNYSIVSKDDAFGKLFSAEGLMGFGGNYNILFFDLYASPWIDIDIQSWQYEFPQWINSLHDCNTNQCLTDLIIFHTSEALRYVVSPHLTFPVKIADKYIIDVIVYAKPGSKNTITPATMKNFVNKEKIKNEFEYLYPSSEWQVDLTLERRDTRNLGYDFKKELESTTNFVFDNRYGNEKSIQILHSDKIQPYLVS